MDIVFDNVSFSYEGQDAPALRGVNLHVEAGEFTVVLGANGSGKSTLAKHVNGLLVPSGGAVRVGGRDTSDAREALELRRRVGMVFQNPDDQAVASVVRDDVAFGPDNLGVEPAEVRARVAEALGRVGMSGHENAQIHELSGGQKQLVAIAGALAMHPQVLVLDEPGAMLDVRGREAVGSIAHELNAQGMTVVLVTHLMDEALRADHVVVLDSGRVALDGDPREVLSDAGRLRALRLAPPFPLELAEKLQERGMDPAAAKAFVSTGGAQAPCGGEIRPMSGARAKSAPCETAAPAPRETPNVADEPEAFLVFDGVGFGYDGAGAPALHDMDLAMPRGAFWGLLGHTGAGKSTVAQLADALLVPTVGRVLVDGLDTAERKNRRKVRSRVGVAFQYPEHQLFAATVAADLAFGPRNLGLAAEQAEQRAREALAHMGLDYDELAERSPHLLSGGQQRRVALAGILAMKPQLLVLDEPAAGMDPAAAHELLDVLRALNADGTGILLITHDMDSAAALCEHVVVLEQGAVMLQGKPSEVFGADNADKLGRVGLGVPRAAEFALGLRERGFAFPALPLTPDALADELAGMLGGRPARRWEGAEDG